MPAEIMIVLHRKNREISWRLLGVFSRSFLPLSPSHVSLTLEYVSYVFTARFILSECTQVHIPSGHSIGVVSHYQYGKCPPCLSKPH